MCSVGNVPLAAVLWNGGISFGGVVAFIFADLIVLPILNIYRKYYGWKMSMFLLVTFYATIVGAGYVVEAALRGARSHTHRSQRAGRRSSISWNYTTVLNLIFLALAAVLVVRS